MKCLKMIFGMVFIAFTFITLQETVVNNTYATSVTCSIPVSGSTDTSYDYTSCVSSLDTSKTWYYKVDFNFASVYNDYFSLRYTPNVNVSTQSLTYIRFNSRSYDSSSCTVNNPLYQFCLNTDYSVFVSDFVPQYHFYYFVFGGYLSNFNSVTVTVMDELSGGITPSGSLSITENGTYDVTNYAEAVVDVPQFSGGSGGDYSDELNGVITAIYTCGAILLVIYFFYCIYRMIIKSTGGK